MRRLHHLLHTRVHKSFGKLIRLFTALKPIAIVVEAYSYEVYLRSNTFFEKKVKGVGNKGDKAALLRPF